MSFWETTKGHILADCLIHNLPKFANRYQYTMEVTDKEVSYNIKNEISKGSRLVKLWKTEENVLLVFEKE